jgi:hypothetical protein
VKAFTRILFLVTLTELVIGGGGRINAIGPMSLRMVLFYFNFCILTSSSSSTDADLLTFFKSSEKIR